MSVSPVRAVSLFIERAGILSLRQKKNVEDLTRILRWQVVTHVLAQGGSSRSSLFSMAPTAIPIDLLLPEAEHTMNMIET